MLATTRTKTKSFMALRVVDLLESTSGTPMEPHWASLTHERRVWVEGVATAKYYQGALYPTLAQ